MLRCNCSEQSIRTVSFHAGKHRFSYKQGEDMHPLQWSRLLSRFNEIIHVADGLHPIKISGVLYYYIESDTENTRFILRIFFGK